MSQRAIEISLGSNDVLAEEVNHLPDRFAGLAALPIQVRKLHRGVRALFEIWVL